MYDQNKADELIICLENILKECNADNAFETITDKLNRCEDVYLNECITPLNYLRHTDTHDWIESTASRIDNVSINWGHLAASSYFSWNRAFKWLEKGRPLSLIALDALTFCTTTGERLNQSLWMQENRPVLIDNPAPDLMALTLQAYLKTDNVPRTRNAVKKIVDNIFDV